MTDHLVEDLPVGVELVEQDQREEGDGTYALKIAVGEGAVLLRVKRRPESAFSDALFEVESARSGALFWREIARWLQVPVPAGVDAEAGRQLPVGVFSMGALPSEDGQDWKALKLFIGDDTDRTEVYLNVAIEADRGQFREKDVAYRAALVAQLRAGFGDVRGLPAIEVAALPPNSKQPVNASISPAPFIAGDAVEHQFGPGTVKSIQTIEMDGEKRVMLEVVLKSGMRLLVPQSAALDVRCTFT